MRRKRSKPILVLLLSLGGLAAAAGDCYENVDVYWPNGGASHCEVFCVVSGGYIARGCSST